jgi:hypothetical protein
MNIVPMMTKIPGHRSKTFYASNLQTLIARVLLKYAVKHSSLIQKFVNHGQQHWPMAKIFTDIIYKLLQKARVFVSRKNLPGMNTLAFYQSS